MIKDHEPNGTDDEFADHVQKVVHLLEMMMRINGVQVKHGCMAMIYVSASQLHGHISRETWLHVCGAAWDELERSGAYADISGLGHTFCTRAN